MFEPPEDPTLGDQVQLTPTRQSQLVVYGSDLQADEVSRGKTQHDKGEHDSFSSPSRSAEGMMPAFSSRQLSHLPTPQSPNNVGSYMTGAPRTPESPVPLGSQPSYSVLAAPPFTQRFHYQSTDSRPVPSTSRSQQILTPESSPLVDRNLTRQPATSSYGPLPLSSSSPRTVQSSSVKLDTSFASLEPAHNISPPVPPPETTRSALSSPFMAKLSLGSAKSKSPQASRPDSPPPQGHNNPVHVDDLFSAETATPTSTLRPGTVYRPSGGEMERIRLQTLEVGMAHFQDTEHRRPEYLKRIKRSLSDSDQGIDTVLDLEERGSVLPGVGITMSPMKGRRLKLFQETSEESFEESLMAGGYERYRNADWIQQSIPDPAGPSASAGIEPVLSDKEIRKRRRLAAFVEASKGGGYTTKLYPVEVEGRGRVLLDPIADNLAAPTETGSTRKKPSRRKKKGAAELAKDPGPGDERGMEPVVPNWPDSEFPWSVRVEEQTEQARVTQEERLRWIEKFLDRDSDEEDDGDDDEILPSTMWGQVYEDAPMPSRRGRGKMIGLTAGPSEDTRRRAFFPSDPADARAALLSKRSVRTLSYRTQQRLMKGRSKTWEEDSDEEEICFCRGRDDGRELVQCDACQTWYHLQCIGIKSIKELGREEDPWYCSTCATRRTARTPSPELKPSLEPTFVPTDERQAPNTLYDPLFYQSLPASPATPWSASRLPRTPTRGGDMEAAISSGSSNDPTRIGPSTPQFSSHGVRIYSTPGPFDSFGSDESSFDPTSTPSRGIKFGAPFATPKNTLWSARAQGLFQTPSRPTLDPSGRPQAGAPNTSSSIIESGGTQPFSSPHRHHPSYDDTPIRRAKPGEGPKFAVPRRLLESPLRFPGGPLQESPVMRSKGKGRGQDVDMPVTHKSEPPQDRPISGVAEEGRH